MGKINKILKLSILALFVLAQYTKTILSIARISLHTTQYATLVLLSCTCMYSICKLYANEHNRKKQDTNNVQYCAKVMQTKFEEYRALFLRYFADISEIYRYDYLHVKTIIRRYLNDISQRLRSGENSPQ